MGSQDLKLIDIYPVIYTAWWDNSSIYFLIGIVILFLCAGIYWLIVRLQFFKKKISQPDLFTMQLKQLQMQEYDNQASIHKAYFDISDILRNMIIFFGKVDQHEQSDHLVEKNIDLFPTDIEKNAVLGLLKRAFLVKFAYQHQTKDQLLDDIKLVQQCLNKLSERFYKV